MEEYNNLLMYTFDCVETAAVFLILSWNKEPLFFLVTEDLHSNVFWCFKYKLKKIIPNFNKISHILK